MEDWSLEVINSYCQEHFGDKFSCVLQDGKGRVMVSKYAVRQGDLLFVEPPLHVVEEDEDNQAFITVQRLCSNNPDTFDYDPLWYWCALCSLTEANLRRRPKVGTLSPIGEQQQRRLLCLYHEPVTTASDAVVQIVRALSLGVDPVLVEELLQAWILNCFEHSEDPLGYSAYFASSFVSHSCGPNAIWSEDDAGGHVLRARRDIAPNDEVTISYLEEHVLLHSADTRRASLQSTKLFLCTCERCAPAAIADDMAGADSGADMCRGFRCPGCKACGVFYRLICETGRGLEGVCCSECGRSLTSPEARRLVQAEASLEARVDKLDKATERRSIADVMPENQAMSLLKAVTDEAGPVGPQHWLVDRAYEHLGAWFTAKGRRSEARRMVQLRVDYMRRAFPGLSGTLAWTLEAQAAMLLSHLGFGGEGKAKASAESLDADEQSEVAAQMPDVYEDARRILTLMFGEDHEYTESLVSKSKAAKAFLDDRSQWATPVEGGGTKKPAAKAKGKTWVVKAS